MFGASAFEAPSSSSQFRVTPSMVIPEADWEAAFASPAASKPAVPDKPAQTEAPQVNIRHVTYPNVGNALVKTFTDKAS